MNEWVLRSVRDRGGFDCDSGGFDSISLRFLPAKMHGEFIILHQQLFKQNTLCRTFNKNDENYYVNFELSYAPALTFWFLNQFPCGFDPQICALN